MRDVYPYARALRSYPLARADPPRTHKGESSRNGCLSQTEKDTRERAKKRREKTEERRTKREDRRATRDMRRENCKRTQTQREERTDKGTRERAEDREKTEERRGRKKKR